MLETIYLSDLQKGFFDAWELPRTITNVNIQIVKNKELEIKEFETKDLYW